MWDPSRGNGDGHHQSRLGLLAPTKVPRGRRDQRTEMAEDARARVSQRRVGAVPSLKQQGPKISEISMCSTAPGTSTKSQAAALELCLKQDSPGLTTCAYCSLCLLLLGNVCTWSRGPLSRDSRIPPTGKELRQGKRQTSVSLPDRPPAYLFQQEGVKQAPLWRTTCSQELAPALGSDSTRRVSRALWGGPRPSSPGRAGK